MRVGDEAHALCDRNGAAVEVERVSLSDFAQSDTGDLRWLFAAKAEVGGVLRAVLDVAKGTLDRLGVR